MKLTVFVCIVDILFSVLLCVIRFQNELRSFFGREVFYNSELDSQSLIEEKSDLLYQTSPRKYPLSVAIYGILVSLVFFQIVHAFFPYFKNPPPHIAKPKNEEFSMDYWKWKNLCISWLHALLCSVWILINIVVYPEHFYEKAEFVVLSSYLMTCLSIGYFTYDFFDMVRNNLHLDLWELSLHHIAITGMMMWNVIDCRLMGWTCIALSAEINSFFLHSRKLCQLHKITSLSATYRLVILFNFASFVIFRFGSSVVIVWGMITPYDYNQVSVSYWLGLLACEWVMNGINPILFIRLIRSDLLTDHSKKKAANGVSNGHSTSNNSNVKSH